ncbi:MAG: hypothetical protein WBM45_16925 [Woeseiaceae bacterium]
MAARDTDNGGGRFQSVWAGLAVYALAGWAAVEITLVVRERLGLPGIVEPIVLGLFAAGFLATVLLTSLHRQPDISPLKRSMGLLAATIACAAVALGVAAWLQVPGDASEELSIVVLPCEYDGDQEHEYLGLGLAEAIHTRLGAQRELRVPSWRSVLKTHGTDPSPEFAAEYLNVDHVATCRVQREGTRVTIEAQILELPNDKPLLQRRYESESADLPMAVARVSESFVDQIAPRIEAKERLRELPTSDPEAYELYLRANALIDPAYQGDKPVLFSEQLKQVEGLLGRAVELDPGFADAFGRLAALQWEYAEFSVQESREEQDKIRSRALSNVVKALQLDDCSVFGWYTAAFMRNDDWYLSRSDEFRKLVNEVDQETMARNAISCQPNEPFAWISLFDHYTVYQAHEPETAEELFEVIATERRAITRAVALDPVDCTTVGAYAGFILLEGFPFARRSIGDQHLFEDDPEAWRTQRAADNRELKQAALDSIRSMMVISPNCYYVFSRLALYFAWSDDRQLDKALAWSFKTIEADPEWVDAVEGVANLYLELGLLKQAAHWGRRAAELSNGGSAVLAETRLVLGDASMLVKGIQWAVANVGDSSSPAQVIRVFGRGAKEAARIGEFELAVELLEQGMARLGVANPVELLPGPRNSMPRRVLALYWAMALQRVDQGAQADALLDESRWRDPVFAEATDMYERAKYLDAYYEALSGNPGEALRLLRHSIESGNNFWADQLPGVHDLARDPILDSVRNHPEYGPQLQDLIEEIEATLAPMRENVLRAEASDDWKPLLVY